MGKKFFLISLLLPFDINDLNKTINIHQKLELTTYHNFQIILFFYSKKEAFFFLLCEKKRSIFPPARIYGT